MTLRAYTAHVARTRARHKSSGLLLTAGLLGLAAPAATQASRHTNWRTARVHGADHRHTRGASARHRPTLRISTPKGSAAARRLLWSDEFNGRAGTSPDEAKWNYDIGGGGWGNQELESNTPRPSNVSLDGQGNLAITARPEAYAGPDRKTRMYTSARIQTLHKFEFTYGLVEARIQVPSGQGLLPQFWMLGNAGYEPGGWPAAGEIDAMEVLGSRSNVAVGTVHGPWGWAPTGVGTNISTPTSLSSGFHVYGVEWSPGRISFLLDGVVYRTITPASLQPGSVWPFTHPSFLVLDLAVGGRWPGSPDSTTRFPARMLVDWIRVWR